MRSKLHKQKEELTGELERANVDRRQLQVGVGHDGDPPNAPPILQGRRHAVEG